MFAGGFVSDIVSEADAVAGFEAQAALEHEADAEGVDAAAAVTQSAF